MLSNIDEQNETKQQSYYIPPFKKREQAKVESINNRTIQQKLWNKLERNIKGEINKLNFSNIELVLINVLKNNLVRGRGILVDCIIKAQLSSQFYTPVISCLSAILNCNIPDFGSLLLKRLIYQFKQSFENSDKLVCKCTLLFLAKLINLRVLHELTGLQICLFLTEKFTDSSIELCIGFILECGEFLLECCPEELSKILNQLRVILQERKVRKKTHFLIQDLLKKRRLSFKKNREFFSENDFIDPKDQITHFIDLLEDKLDLQEELNCFTEVEHTLFEKENKQWEEFSIEMISGLVEEEGTQLEENNLLQGSVVDHSHKEILALRKQIYLCIMNSLSFEECAHRLLKLDIFEKHVDEVSTMLLECCSMERTYQKFFSLVAERLCILSNSYKSSFKKLFTISYETAYKLETNKLRQVTKLFSYLLSKDVMPWDVLGIIILSEQETASSSRIFIKVLFQGLFENMGIYNLNQKLNSQTVSIYTEGIFPNENLSRIRFSINFFTAIGLSGLTSKLREKMKLYEQYQYKKFNKLYLESLSTEENKFEKDDIDLLAVPDLTTEDFLKVDYSSSDRNNEGNSFKLDRDKEPLVNKIESYLQGDDSICNFRGKKRRKERSFSRE